MDEDTYNVVETGDIFGDTSGLDYRNEDYEELNSHILSELNNSSRRAPKRPLTIDSCDAVALMDVYFDYYFVLDWHMRIPCTLEEIEGKRRKEEHDELILKRLTQRIIQARKRHNYSIEGAEDTVAQKVDGLPHTILKYPPIDGTPWITVSSPDCCRRFYLRLKKLIGKQNVYSCGTAKTFSELSSVVAKARASLSCDSSASARLEETLPSSLRTKQEKLWVDKYSPRFFPDLVSDDVVLIAGPAGTGKTTLATVVAQHAGYAVAEVNASDDRSVTVFEKRIEEAVRTVKTLGVDSKPICLLLDEIDGAPAESIRLLCKIVNKTGRGLVRRPIICVCNNLYTPSLRELRSTALVLSMRLPDEERLTKRLREIAEKEHVLIENKALATLVSTCGVDMRLSINGLQYLAAKFSSSVIDSDLVLKFADIERCYTERTLLDAWSCIFEQRNHLDIRGKLSSLQERAKRVLTVTERCSGDSNRFFLGLFHNYLRAIFGPNGISTVIAQRRKQSVETLQSLKSKTSFATDTERMLALDFLPLFIIIVQPPLKQANTQLFTQKEKQLFQNVVATMCFYSITFKPVYQDGATNFAFEPRVDLIALFPLDDVGEDSHQLAPLPKGARQAIAHQIELVNLKHPNTELGKTRNANPSPSSVAPVRTKSYASNEKTGPLVYHYNHGFSNAIRRSIRMRNLFFDN